MSISPVMAQVDKLAVKNQDHALEIVRQAENLYVQGSLTAAVDKWKQAANIYALQNNKLNQAMALSNLALTYAKLGNREESLIFLDKSFHILNNLANTTEQQRIFAQTLDIQGQQRFIQGQREQALASWQEAAKVYTNIGEKEALFSNQVNQAQAMQKLGFYPRSCLTLLRAFKINGQDCQITDEELENLKIQIITDRKHQIKLSQVKGLHTLGNALRGVGKLKQSQQVLLTTLEMVENLFPEYESNILLSLGNTERALCQDKSCQLPVNYYQKAIRQTSSKEIKLQGLLNQIDLSQDISLIDEAEKVITDLPRRQTTIYAEIKLAEYQFCKEQKQLNCLQQREETDLGDRWNQDRVSQTVRKLISIAKDAEELGDKRTQSYALAMVGRVYEKLGQWQRGREYTQSGLEIAQQLKAVDISYQIQWQLGRILLNQGQKQEAIAAYADAVNSLQTLRNDLVSLNPDLQYDFRERVEPVYRRYVDLLLQDHPNQDNLQKARELIESLQLAELENFFRDACIENQEINIDDFVTQSAQNNSPTAIFYAIVLPQRLEIILTVPQKPLLHYTTDISQPELETTLKALQQELKSPSRRESQLSQKVYDWLFGQVEPDLAKNNIQTVVFILDSYLRNIPMAALDDGQKYLVEKYAIAYSPGLKLIQPQPLKKQELSALSAGIDTDKAPSIEARKLGGLPFVSQELDEIKAQVSGEQLRNQDFTKNNFKLKIDQTAAQVIHLATHGQFSSNNEETFILAWDKSINIQELEQLLRSRDPLQSQNIELLVLSACETAAGDNRAALGLAGVAVRSGARSTLATLWQVDDDSTAALMKQFYQELINNPELTKAQALQKAQLHLLNYYRVPHKWAAVVLVGNWL
ncbi:CHAT domain-containing protein [Nodularia spumigena CS-586/05]|uniref:CHAT domain-containing protein n=1 Tax=Nodularia spumigena TaxID=70799 RepID=UPI002330AC9E|nr:CHAT domain-containing protein [Nodularia spumigena]MDB9344838.1 CHAT domain-containing protein [Nodularia spumigena CS-588/06]MDB9370958.1 CHAT domain-containing protein [Nodularia spumigena CS-586/05]